MRQMVARGCTRLAGALRDRAWGALAVSLAAHLAVGAALWWLGGPRPVHTARRGEPLLIELQERPEPPPAGNPAAAAPGTPATSRRSPALPPRATAPRVEARAAPATPPDRPRASDVQAARAVPAHPTVPAPPESPPPATPQPAARQATPDPAPEPPARPAQAPQAPPPTVAPPRPVEASEPPPAVARSAPEVSPPVPRVAEPEPPRTPDLVTGGPTQPRPQPVEPPLTTREAAPSLPSPGRQAPPASGPPRAAEAGVQDAGGGDRGTPARAGAGDSRVAAVPPAREAPIDSLAAFRRGAGAGGRGGGWGGITGDAISLNSSDPRYGDYLERLRRAIQAKMVFPCIKDPETLRCTPKDAQLVVDMGLTRDGGLQVVELMRSSGMSVYDEVSINAIKLAQPFPPVPAAMLEMQPRGSRGVRITVLFSYVVNTWTQILVR